MVAVTAGTVIGALGAIGSGLITAGTFLAGLLPTLQKTEGQILLWALVGADVAIESLSTNWMGLSVSLSGLILFPLNMILQSTYGAVHLWVILSCVLLIKFVIWSKIAAGHK